MSTTYTIANLHFTPANLQNTDFMDACKESIWDLVPDNAVYTHNYQADTGSWEIVMERGTMSTEDLAHLQAELSMMPAAFA